MCPAPRTIESTNGQPVDVTYPDPMVSGGASPVIVECTPPTASNFAIGSTSVSCTATDARSRTDSCVFTVAVIAPPRISGTTFVCFGDSMTEGLNLPIGPSIAPRLIPNPPGSYPADLQTLLSGRYSAQAIAVLDEGIGGEGVTAGMRRLPGVLASDHPDTVLLLEGVNDLNALGASGIPTVAAGLRAMVREIRGHGLPIFLATLPPQREGGRRAFSPALIEPANEQIRAIASEEGAVLVDLYRAFRGEIDLLIADDGLHPNAAWYQRMAESFFEAIRANLEVAPGAMTLARHGVSRRRRGVVGLPPAGRDWRKSCPAPG